MHLAVSFSDAGFEFPSSGISAWIPIGETAGEALVLLEVFLKQEFCFPLGVFLILRFCDSYINNKYGLVEVNKILTDVLPTLL